MAERYADILVVDLLGGLGDLVMALPAVHALAHRNPGAALRVLTHAPGDALLRSDPAVSEVRRAVRGRERAAVRAELDRRLPDLVVSTTRYDGIAEEIESCGVRCVTDLWRRPPADEPVARRYLRILAAEGLVEDTYAPPVIHLTGAERSRGARMLAGYAAGPPVVLVPQAGMAVKWWPHWPALAAGIAAARGAPALVVGERAPRSGWLTRLARPLPPIDLRGLAALFAAVARRAGVVVGPDTGPLRVAGGRRPDRRAVLADRGSPLRPRPTRGRPAGPAGLPAPPRDSDHRAGVLVGRPLPTGSERAGVHGRHRTRRRPGRRPWAPCLPAINRSTSRTGPLGCQVPTRCSRGRLNDVTFQRHIEVSDESVTVTARQIDNAVVLKVIGELDLAAAPHLGTAVSHALDDPDAAAVVVDLTAVTFLSSSGITTLITAHQHAVQRGRPLRVVIGRCRNVLRALQLTGVDWLLALYDTLEQALDAEPRGGLGAVKRR